jgi:hypothetical protein
MIFEKMVPQAGRKRRLRIAASTTLEPPNAAYSRRLLPLDALEHYDFMETCQHFGKQWPISCSTISGTG